MKLHLRKLESRCSGPYAIFQIFPNRAVKSLMNEDDTLKVNEQRLKPYYESHEGSSWKSSIDFKA